MIKYTINRIIMVPILLLLVAFFIFILLNLSESDPVVLMLPSEYTQADYDAMEAKFGLDKPMPVQYFNWVVNFVQGDMGTSFKTQGPVADDVGFRIPISLKLAFITTLIMVILGIPLGVMCAVKQYTAFDSIVNVLAKFLGSIPGFWLGLILIMTFSVNLGWFPTYGTGTLRHWVLPVFTLLLPFLANYVRQVRSAMLDCIRQDYIRTARSKGAKEGYVIFREALKNALLPIITLTGGIFATMIGGAVLVEKVFAIPGVGFKIVEAINSRDMPTLLACTMILAIFTIMVQLIVDLSYALVDPRIRSSFAGKKKRKETKKLKEEVA
ncbi:peptide/nickel transport system permease protein [Anaerobacterium chartisolvens]|uniref:Peptide/nickel transport system permease protein n=1 Tax=Anaerobacterium chartisolvens TaxID=1297424 RepID=A0A369B407_9FIRM|nr:ABC transporter permease [Anaerobacterium chartisolvens]RCX16055.1 peptide/nickel transport system permease protein [Anaerobacterium chartisolvens]